MQIALPVAEPRITITDADNKVTTFTYDSRGLLLTSKDALNNQASFTYDGKEGC